MYIYCCLLFRSEKIVSREFNLFEVVSFRLFCSFVHNNDIVFVLFIIDSIEIGNVFSSLSFSCSSIVFFLFFAFSSILSFEHLCSCSQSIVTTKIFIRECDLKEKKTERKLNKK